MLHERALAAGGGDPAARLRLTHEGEPAEAVLAAVLEAYSGEVALVSSFGADAAVLLHMTAALDRDLPVLLVDTLMLFPETLAYQRELSVRLGLRDVRRVRAEPAALAAADPDDALHRRDPDACCDLRKVAPLARALEEFPVVISGRKRFQAATRAGLEVFEAEGPRLRVNPLAAWSARDLADYMAAHDLPRHPLVAMGYPSIGCAPCTSRVAAGEDARAGRWRGTAKVECGIHIGADGRIVRAS